MKARINHCLNADVFKALERLEKESIDLIIADPPYNLSKRFNDTEFRKTNIQKYSDYLDGFLAKSYHVLKPTGSIYVCGDWYSSCALFDSLSRHFIVRSRLTWKRDKGRASKSNWKNNLEDIYFATKSNQYTFNAVKIKKKVIAPYRLNGVNRDWYEEGGKPYRLTACGNFIDNVTIPFWSMKENTIHPTQKPEKLMAKLILASSREGDVVLDLFSGSGTTSAVAQKLNRQFIAIEIDKTYCAIIRQRLAQTGKDIQGYKDGAFLERNHNV